MRLFFLHSNLQLSIYAKIGRQADLVILNRSLKVPHELISAKKVIEYKNFALADIASVKEILHVIRKNKVTEIFFPHSHTLNKLFPLIVFFERKIKISYIEDGAATWRFVKKNREIHKFEIIFSSLKLSILKFFYWLLLSNNSIFSRKILGKVCNYLQSQLPTEQYICPANGETKIYTSFNLSRNYNMFIDISKINKYVTKDLNNHVSFFLSPRYLESGATNLVNVLSQLPLARIICIVVHPTFWKKEKLVLLNKFFDDLKFNNIRYKVFSAKHFDLDVTFELFLRGCREFWCVDSTTEITINSYPDFFRGAQIINLQKEVTGKTYMLKELGRRENVYKI